VCSHAISLNPAGSMTITISPGLLRCRDSLADACSVSHRPDLVRTQRRGTLSRSSVRERDHGMQHKAEDSWMSL
jgi:hypothetical protein